MIRIGSTIALPTGSVRLASNGYVRHIVRICPIGAHYSRLDLGVARTPAGECRIDPGSEPYGQNAMRLGRRRHCDRKAVDQLVMGIGSIVPTEKLIKGHAPDRRPGHF